MAMQESHLRLVPSVIQWGTRIRVVRDQPFQRPVAESFHDFLPFFLYFTLGDAWWKQEKAQPEKKKHVVMKWYDAVRQWYKAKRAEHHKIQDGYLVVPVSGNAQSLLQL